VTHQCVTASGIGSFYFCGKSKPESGCLVMQDRAVKIRRKSWTIRSEELCGFYTVNQIMQSY